MFHIFIFVQYLFSKNYLACSDDNKFFKLDLKVHVNQDTINAIHSILLQTDKQITEKEAVAEYFGPIIDELNAYLNVFHIKIHLNLDSYNTDEFLADSIIETSCEIGNPVETKTSVAFEYLKKTFNDNIGLQLFVWSCIYTPPMAELQVYYPNFRCGRVMGIIWDGMENTRELVSSAIMNAITGMEHSVIKTGNVDKEVKVKGCAYVQECLGMDPNQIGVIEFLS